MELLCTWWGICICSKQRLVCKVEYKQLAMCAPSSSCCSDWPFATMPHALSPHTGQTYSDLMYFFFYWNDFFNDFTQFIWLMLELCMKAGMKIQHCGISLFLRNTLSANYSEMKFRNYFNPKLPVWFCELAMTEPDQYLYCQIEYTCAALMKGCFPNLL